MFVLCSCHRSIAQGELFPEQWLACQRITPLKSHLRRTASDQLDPKRRASLGPLRFRDTGPVRKPPTRQFPQRVRGTDRFGSAADRKAVSLYCP
jgi:hypothetical protein